MSSMPLALFRPGFIGLAAALALSVHAADPVTVYFLHADQTVRESGTANLYLEMSTYPLTTVVVPFRILDEASTATRQTLDSGGNLTEGDYYLAADEDPDDGNGFLFNPETGEGSFTWLGYPARRTLPYPITLSGDDIVEGDETIVFEIDETGLVNATTAAPLKTHTLTILDDDEPDSESPYPAHAFFAQDHIAASEGATLSIPVTVLSPSPQSRRLHWTIVDGVGTANAEDDIFIDPDDVTPYSVDVANGLTSANITINFTQDLIVEGDETFQVKLTQMEYLDENGDPTGTGDFVVDETPITVTIRDDDPTTVQLDFSDFLEEEWDGVTLTEGTNGQIALQITLSSPLDNPVEIPLTFGGTALRGTSSATAGNDWYPSPDPVDSTDAAKNDVVTIAAGTTRYILTLVIVNDIDIEADGETITVSLGTPEMVVTTTDSSNNTTVTRTPISLGTVEDNAAYRTSYTVTIDDNDPVDIGFGKSNPALQLEDPADDEPPFIADAEIIAAESSGGVNLPIFASSTLAVNGTFEIEVVSDGTTAQMLDPKSTDDQDWDFFVVVTSTTGSNVIEKLDTPVVGTFPAGTVLKNIAITFHDDKEPALPYRHFDAWSGGATIPDEGDEAYSTIEQDEFIHLRLTQITNFDQSGILLREASDGIDPRDISIRIREMPDIDVTEVFDGLTPMEDNFVDGNPPRNPKTRLHELHFNLEPSAPYAADFLARRGTAEAGYADGDGTLDGYTHYKLAFRPSVYDTENPDAATNDPLRPRDSTGGVLTADDIDGFTPYLRLAVPTFTPRFADGFDLLVLQEGVEQPADRPAFFEENADIVALQPFIAWPLNFGTLDPVPEIVRDGYNELDAPMDFLVEFSNGGQATFSAEQRALRLADIRLLLTRSTDNTSTGSSYNGSITGFEELDNGAMRLELYNANGATLRIQYMDAEGDDAGVWKTARPGLIYGTGTNFYWIDQGPPKTDKHPSEVNFRLYRISN